MSQNILCMYSSIQPQCDLGCVQSRNWLAVFRSRVVLETLVVAELVKLFALYGTRVY